MSDPCHHPKRQYATIQGWDSAINNLSTGNYIGLVDDIH